MDRKKIARILNEIAVLLELKGENAFKIRAYTSAARTVELLEGDIAALVKTGEIKQVKGIGKTLAQHITELVTSGSLAYYDELKSSIPSGLIEMLELPGLGPKKIKTLHDLLNISSIAELEYACHENRLLILKGFGEKTQQNILRGIEHLRKFQGYFLFNYALSQANEMVLELGASGAVSSVSCAGSIRRKKEIVKDIDIIASARESAPVMDLFCRSRLVETVLSRGKTKSSVLLKTGINTDLRVVLPSEYPYALHHFTGSKEHNTAVRHRAKGLGLKINEYGIFKGDTIIEAEDEIGFFNRIGLDYIPPELREDMGEIAAAERGTLPKLISSEDIKGTFHVHTRYSDGVNSLEELYAEAKQLGLTYIGISDHSQSAFYAGGLKPDDIKRQHEEIRAFNSTHPDVYFFHGIESDIHPDGSLDYSDDILKLFDFVIASVHSGFTITKKDATDRLIKAIRNPFTTMLGHPTGRLLLGRQGYEPDMNEVILAAKDCGVIIEFNASPMRLDIDWRYLKTVKKEGVLISINPDAHCSEELYDTFSGVGFARKGWLEKQDVFNSFTAEEVQRYFKKRKETCRAAVS